MYKIKLINVRNIPLLDEAPKEQKDYILALKVQLTSVENVCKEGEEEADTIFKMEVVSPEMLQEVGETKKRKIAGGFTKSQQLRKVIEVYLASKGLDNVDDKDYEREMDKLIKYFNDKTSAE